MGRRQPAPPLLNREQFASLTAMTNPTPNEMHDELVAQIGVLKATRPDGWQERVKVICDRLAQMDGSRPLPDAGPMGTVNTLDVAKPQPGVAAFDDEGQPVPVSQFDFETIYRNEEGSRQDDAAEALEQVRGEERRETLRWVLSVILDGTPDRDQIARRVLSMAYLLGTGDPRTKTVRALADSCGVSKSRAGQELDNFREKILRKARF